MMVKGALRCARALAVAGGILLGLLALLSIVSIVGRAFTWAGLGPVPGDFELIEIGGAIAVFCFLPWTYVRNGHAAVHVIRLPRGLQRILRLVCDAVMVVLWAVLSLQLWKAMLEKHQYGETTFILQLPLAWPYAVCLAAALIGLWVYVVGLLVDTETHRDAGRLARRAL